LKRLALVGLLCVGCAEGPEVPEKPVPAPPGVYQPIRKVVGWHDRGTFRNDQQSSLEIVEVDYGGETHAFLLCTRYGIYDQAIAKIGTYPSKASVPPKP
jgi:hypothetical protein